MHPASAAVVPETAGEPSPAAVQEPATVLDEAPLTEEPAAGSDENRPEALAPAEPAPLPAGETSLPPEPEAAKELPEPAPSKKIGAEEAGQIPGGFDAGRPVVEIKTLKFPGLDSGQARSALLQFVQEQVDRAGARKVVLGLSGGLDSAVAANLLLEALGRERTHFIFCLEGERSHQDRGRAGLVARFLKCGLDIHDLQPVLQAGIPGWQQLSPAERQPHAARLRAAYLYHQAERLHGLVAGSVNKTKCWVGQLGRHAELSCDFNLLGDLYQSQVFELARSLNVPRVVLEYAAHPGSGRPPLKAWKEVDYLLYQVLDARISLSHLQRLGAHPEKLRWVYQRIRESAALRQTAPIADAQRAYVPRGGSF